eukprot:m.750340 g.750340  ORF g.750340 m.750340 type:complete len:109 (-) comp23157_c0_seq7:395-721(-)
MRVCHGHRFGVVGESYHYTSLAERDGTDSFVARGGASRQQKSHSSHFHLKMRIASGMLLQRLPVHALLDLDVLRQKVEPVKYNYTRDTVPWDEVKALMEKDIKRDDDY